MCLFTPAVVPPGAPARPGWAQPQVVAAPLRCSGSTAIAPPFSPLSLPTGPTTPRSGGFAGGAARTQSPHVEHALDQAEAKTAGGLAAFRQHHGTLELLGAPATHTDQVMVIAVGITGQLEATPPFGQFQFPQQLHRTEQPQGAVHGGQRHPFVRTQEALMDFLGAEVTAFTDPLEQREHLLPLGREPLASPMQAGAQLRGRTCAGRNGGG